MSRILGINPEEPITKILKCTEDLGMEDHVAFTVNQMNAMEYSRYQDAIVNMQFEGGGKKGRQKTITTMHTAQLSVDLLIKYLVSISNYYYPCGGQAVLLELSPIGRDEARRREISRIAPAHRQEIAEVITGYAELSEDDEKN